VVRPDPVARPAPFPAFGFIYPHGAPAPQAAPITQTAAIELAMADKAQG
jgi:hypothetical protein